MTICFVTDHDPPTFSNLSIAKKVVSAGDLSLFGASATRLKLHEMNAAEAPERAIFAMGHGGRDALFDNFGMPALHAADVSTFEGRRIFAFACHTSTRLGHEMAKGGVTWWGYDCAVTAPDERASYAAVYIRLFKCVKTSFPSGVDESTVNRVLVKIQKACLRASEQLDKLGANDDDDATSLYSCCDQVWKRLSVWLMGSCMQPITHPSAPPPYIDI